MNQNYAQNHALAVRRTSDGAWESTCACGWTLPGWSDALIAKASAERHIKYALRVALTEESKSSGGQMPAKKKTSATPKGMVNVFIQKGEEAVCLDPSQCLIGRKFSAQGFKSPDVNQDTVAFTVYDNHPLVESGELLAGRYTWETTKAQAYFIGQFDGGSEVPEVRAAKADAEFTFDLSKAKFSPKVVKTPERLAKEAEYDRTDPIRRVQRQGAHERAELRKVNAGRRRVGLSRLTMEQFLDERLARMGRPGR